MGSTQPQDVNLPYGLTLDGSQDFLFMDPPEPAPGQPILSDNDTKLLSSFFEDLTSDNYHTTSFGEGLNFSDDWLNLPPQFMGTATSFGQHPHGPLESPIPALSSGSFPELLPATSSLMPPPPPPIPPPVHPGIEKRASADVLAAAQLLQNGSMSRPSSSNHVPMFTSTRIGPSAGPPPVGHLRHQPMADFRQENRRQSEAELLQDRGHTFAEMMFGTSSRPGPVVRPHLPMEVQWGTDSNFDGPGNFMPRSRKETQEALENHTLSCMGCLEVSTTATTTGPSSPVEYGDAFPFKVRARHSLAESKVGDDLDTPPRKRRKSTATEEIEDFDDEDATNPSSRIVRKRKSKADLAATHSLMTAGKEASGKRRKSSTVPGSKVLDKNARENLSEEQKRENHIKSEQRRRTLIKEGFDDLCDLVPGLKGGGFSKSTMLAMAAEWLEELLQGNEKLQDQLNTLDAR